MQPRAGKKEKYALLSCSYMTRFLPQLLIFWTALLSQPPNHPVITTCEDTADRQTNFHFLVPNKTNTMSMRVVVLASSIPAPLNPRILRLIWELHFMLFGSGLTRLDEPKTMERVNEETKYFRGRVLSLTLFDQETTIAASNSGSDHGQYDRISRDCDVHISLPSSLCDRLSS